VSFLGKLFGKKKKPEPPKDYVICPRCGAGFNTEMIMFSITRSSPFLADMASWQTRVVCSNCRAEFGVSGSYNQVFGKPKPQ
jgi:hypothetical protein